MSENNPEDSMEEIEVNNDDDSSLTPYERDFDQVDMMLSQAINISNEGSLHEPTCAICNSSLRHEVEELWDQNRKTLPISRLLKERSNISVGSEIITNHMKNHKDSGIQEMKKVEFVDRVRRLYSNNATTLEGIKLSMAIIMDQIVQVSSMLPSGDKSEADIKKIQSSETNSLMRTYTSLMKLQATIMGEMKDSGEIITIPRDKFIKVFNESLINAKNDREREVITGILNGLKN